MEIKSLQHNEQALKLRSLRNQVLAANIANADTPNFKARDIDFKTALAAAKGDGISLRTTNDLHFRSMNTAASGAEVLYRVPMQPSLDGNTVEVEREQVEYSANAVSYQASLRFLEGKIKGIRTAIKGSSQ